MALPPEGRYPFLELQQGESKAEEWMPLDGKLKTYRDREKRMVGDFTSYNAGLAVSDKMLTSNSVLRQSFEQSGELMPITVDGDPWFMYNCLSTAPESALSGFIGVLINSNQESIPFQCNYDELPASPVFIASYPGLRPYFYTTSTSPFYQTCIEHCYSGISFWPVWSEDGALELNRECRHWPINQTPQEAVLTSIAHNRSDKFLECLSNGTDLNYCHREHGTPLKIAVATESPAFFRLLIEHGANPWHAPKKEPHAWYGLEYWDASENWSTPPFKEEVIEWIWKILEENADKMPRLWRQGFAVLTVGMAKGFSWTMRNRAQYLQEGLAFLGEELPRKKVIGKLSDVVEQLLNHPVAMRHVEDALILGRAADYLIDEDDYAALANDDEVLELFELLVEYSDPWINGKMRNPIVRQIAKA